MKYKVHRLDVNTQNIQEKLELFLNSIQGEVVSVIPHVEPTMWFLGGAAKVKFLLIVEKLTK